VLRKLKRTHFELRVLIEALNAKRLKQKREGNKGWGCHTARDKLPASVGRHVRGEMV
jgi:hypothetical protein